MHRVDVNLSVGLGHGYEASMMIGCNARKWLGKMHGVSRERKTNRRAISPLAYEAMLQGRFNNELVSIEGHDAEANKILVEGGTKWIRPRDVYGIVSGNKNLFLHAKFPVTVTAGTSFCLVLTVRPCDADDVLRRKRKNWVLNADCQQSTQAWLVGCCDSAIMGYGPGSATQKALKRAGLTIDDIDIVRG